MTAPAHYRPHPLPILCMILAAALVTAVAADCAQAQASDEAAHDTNSPEACCPTHQATATDADLSEPLVVEVQLQQASAGEPLPLAGIQVQLIMMINNQQAPQPKVEADSSGVARIVIDRRHLQGRQVPSIAAALYNGVNYYSQPMLLTAGTRSPVKTVVEVQHTSDDAAQLHIRQTIILLETVGSSLRINDFYSIYNPTDRVIISRDSSRPLLTNTLPDGARYMRHLPEPSAQYNAASNQLQLLGPFAPGVTVIENVYLLPVTKWPAMLTWPLDLAEPGHVEVGLASREFEVEGPLGPPQVNRELFTRPVLLHNVVAEDLDQPDQLTLLVLPHRQRSLPGWSYALTAAVAVLAAGVVMFRRSDRLLADEES